MSRNDKIDLLRECCERLQRDKIVDFWTSLGKFDTETRLLTSSGGDITQCIRRIQPGLSTTANEGVRTQTRSLVRDHIFQGGLEVLDAIEFRDTAGRLSAEAVDLLAADDCPTGKMDMILGPGQMILQVHESIGHPLELDRVLGDERNYAGTSFVKPESFGHSRYGSDVLNVTYDPNPPGEVASFAFDDDGTPAQREYLIEKGILKRGLGGVTSQTRLGLPGVACARSSSWNRPPIDRMANVNLEPGTESLDDLISGVERGVFMDSNQSWSIDDSRLKFQFGCEWGRLIENGELTSWIRNPNYRGITPEFWASLDGVGNEDTRKVLGTPNCGKGEPQQLNTAGHAAPACRFRNIEVFGGDGS